MANKNSFKKGTIELLLLSILNTEDCYGYQITQRIKEQSEGNITVTEGALYPILYKLSDKGYISDYKKLAGKRLMRVYYHLEENGRNYLNNLFEEYLKVQEGVQKILSANHIEVPK
ncbi:PadR family transcriptional regulator [Eubacterium sp. An3]|uniref:PadR family transcriptional regulator n=1 Tax=Eubacterium sp. An3 TaxID=1965628 RepID=UPI000B3B00C0|nr:PadR family transcriptional regulator [Eubacterium sp. An3]OUO24844.1 transcriptional regulator [Eubacterium sp. An3]